jgi:hypothetical protein
MHDLMVSVTICVGMAWKSGEIDLDFALIVLDPTIARCTIA